MMSSYRKPWPLKMTAFIYLASFTAIIVCSWIGFGDFHDEAEHCHVAWLIGKAGLTPIRDFFQHHQPLFWDVLKLYYVWGGDGPEIYYYGRTIVSGCLVVSMISLTLISRSNRIGADREFRIFP